MNSAETLRDALARLAERYDSYSVLPRGDFAELAARDQQWAREQIAELGADEGAAVFCDPPEPRPWAVLMGQVFDLYIDTLERCVTDEQRNKATARFAAAVNALCELAVHPHEMNLGGAR